MSYKSCEKPGLLLTEGFYYTLILLKTEVPKLNSQVFLIFQFMYLFFSSVVDL